MPQVWPQKRQKNKLIKINKVFELKTWKRFFFPVFQQSWRWWTATGWRATTLNKSKLWGSREDKNDGKHLTEGHKEADGWSTKKKKTRSNSSVLEERCLNSCSEGLENPLQFRSLRLPPFFSDPGQWEQNQEDASNHINRVVCTQATANKQPLKSKMTLKRSLSYPEPGIPLLQNRGKQVLD